MPIKTPQASPEPQGCGLGCVFFLVKHPLPLLVGGWVTLGMPVECPSERDTSLHPFFFHLLGRCWAKLLFQGPEHPFNQDTAARKDEQKALRKADRALEQRFEHVQSPSFPFACISLVFHNWVHSPASSFPLAGPKTSLFEAEHTHHYPYGTEGRHTSHC